MAEAYKCDYSWKSYRHLSCMPNNLLHARMVGRERDTRSLARDAYKLLAQILHQQYVSILLNELPVNNDNFDCFRFFILLLPPPPLRPVLKTTAFMRIVWSSLITSSMYMRFH